MIMSINITGMVIYCTLNHSYNLDRQTNLQAMTECWASYEYREH